MSFDFLPFETTCIDFVLKFSSFKILIWIMQIPCYVNRNSLLTLELKITGFRFFCIPSIYHSCLTCFSIACMDVDGFLVL